MNDTSTTALYRRHRATLFALLFFTCLLVIDAWPLLRQMDQVLIGADADTRINPWADWWTAKALSDPDISFWYTNYLFYPDGASLIYHSFSHLNTALSLLLQTALAPLPAYNLAILANYLLAGLAGFQLTRYLTKSAVAGLLAGVVFAFNTHFIYQSSHPVLICIWCIPWFTLFVLRAVDEAKDRYVLAAAVFYFLAALSSVLLLIITSLWAGGLLLYLWWRDRPVFPYRRIGRLLLTGLILILPVVYPIVAATLSRGESSFVISGGASTPSNLATFFIPPWIRWENRGVYLGLPLMLLLALARPKAGFWWLAFAVVCLLAIGPQPVWGSQALPVTLPWSRPIVALLRHAHRLNILITLCFSVLVGFAWVALADRLRRRSLPAWAPAALGMALAVLVYVDYTAFPFPVTRLFVSSFYSDYLDDVPDDVALAIIPFGRQEDKRYLYYQTIHQHPMTGGVISRPVADTFAFIENNPILAAGMQRDDLPPLPPGMAAELANLARYNIGYLVIHKNLLTPEQVETWRAAMPGMPVFEDAQLMAFELAANDP